ncbi:methyl-accepting chemotaxis protein [Dethiosulfatarculus sandiegensis]|uniref:Methyl-accepting chemotaxis protein n=1 Tax=Dethiosulfatarculus sandiegensis TaxID=1429043 RepID=A0A0D2HNE5_9BACT|nr:methyl-accepting chemotaxis protein [Dethiosulfatarculus sandiegensis]KIX12063.1 methyl-accepting chemotaxis protein [Dethiosulfatarculus sandiegensis]
MKKLNLKLKIILPIVTLIVLSMGFATFFSYRSSSIILEQSITQKIKGISSAAAHNLGVWCQDKIWELNGLSGLPELKQGVLSYQGKNLAQADDTLVSFGEKRNLYERLALVNKNGEYLATSDGDREVRLNIQDRPYFQKALAGNPAVSPVLKSRVSGHPIITVAVPIKEGSSVAGVLVGIIDLQKVTDQLITPLDTGGAGYLYVLDDSGRIVSHPDQSLVLNNQVAETDFGRQILRQQHGVHLYDYQGIEKIAAFCTAPLLNWRVVATADTETLFAMAKVVRNKSLMIGGIVILLGLFLTLWLGVSITKPVVRELTTLEVSSAEVSTAASQVAATGQSLAQGASTQAETVQDFSLVLESISQQIEKNNLSTATARDFSKETQVLTEEAGEAMQNLDQGMDQLQEASGEMAGIVRTIEEIAFKTNLLSLNAAVEAARAGEAGRGFSVVAEEVGSLAANTAKAAQETGALIQANLERIKVNTNLVRTTSQGFAKLTDMAGKSAVLMSEIAEANQEQTREVKHLNQSMRQVDDTIQNQSSFAEESAAASEELHNQAREVAQVVENLGQVIHGMKDRADELPVRTSLNKPVTARLLTHGA